MYNHKQIQRKLLTGIGGEIGCVLDTLSKINYAQKKSQEDFNSWYKNATRDLQRKIQREYDRATPTEQAKFNWDKAWEKIKRPYEARLRRLESDYTMCIYFGDDYFDEN